MKRFGHLGHDHGVDQRDDSGSYDPDEFYVDLCSRVIVDHAPLVQRSIGTATPEDAQIPRRPIARNLHWVLVTTTPQGNRLVNNADIERTSRSFDQLVDDAMQDFEVGAIERWASLDDSVFVPVIDGSSTTSRILHPRGSLDLPFTGAAVLFLPSTSNAIVAPATNHYAVKRAAELADYFADASQPLSLNPLIGRHGRWQSFRPSKSHAAHDACARLAVLQEHVETEYQGQLLNEFFKGEVKASAVRRIETDEAWLSLCHWARDVPTLLPKTDIIGFTSRSGTSPFFTPWETVTAICGTRLLRTQHNPVRYLACDYPSIAQLRELRRARLRIH